MKLAYHFHNFQPEQASPLVRQTLQVLEDVCLGLPYLVWPAKSKKLTTGEALSERKTRELSGLECLQSVNNTWLRQELQERGFEAECQVRDGALSADDQRVDFAKLVEDMRRVLIEVEFGYTASMERNFFKLQDAYHHGRSVLGVMVCPTTALARKIASGVATFETARERLLAFHPLTMPVPLVLLGLDYAGATRIDLSQSRLKNLGPDCLSGNQAEQLRWHVARELRAGVAVQDIGLPPALQHLELTREMSAVSRLDERQPELFA